MGMSTIYDGKRADSLTRGKLIKAILREHKVASEVNIVRPMEEAFRCGYLRGEEDANIGNRSLKISLAKELQET